MRRWLARIIAPAAFADAERTIANLRRGIASAQDCRDFWMGEYERVTGDPDEARRAAIHRLARKVEAKRRAA